MKNQILGLVGTAVIGIAAACYFVPYTGAEQDTDLGEYSLKGAGVTATERLTVGDLTGAYMMDIGAGFCNIPTASNTIGSSSSDATSVIGNFSQTGAGTTVAFAGNASFAGTVNVTGAITGETIAKLTPQNVNTNAATYDILSSAFQYNVNFTGSGCTAKLPLAPISNGRTFYLANFGSADVVVNTFSGGNDIWIGGSVVNTITIPVGGTVILRCGNSKFIKFG